MKLRHKARRGKNHAGADGKKNKKGNHRCVCISDASIAASQNLNSAVNRKNRPLGKLIRSIWCSISHCVCAIVSRATLHFDGSFCATACVAFAGKKCRGSLVFHQATGGKKKLPGRGGVKCQPSITVTLLSSVKHTTRPSALKPSQKQESELHLLLCGGDRPLAVKNAGLLQAPGSTAERFFVLVRGDEQKCKQTPCRRVSALTYSFFIFRFLS